MNKIDYFNQLLERLMYEDLIGLAYILRVPIAADEELPTAQVLKEGAAKHFSYLSKKNKRAILKILRDCRDYNLKENLLCNV